MSLSPVQHAALGGSASDVKHGFFTRKGGVSTGDYTSLNVGLGSDDDQTAIAENRRRIASFVGAAPENLVAPWQYHSADVVVATGPWNGDRPKADAVVTNVPGVAASVVTADCGPVLFHDDKHSVIGAAHAGWRGAFGGVLENTIAAMEGLGADRANITAVLGPTISQKNYEVGPEFHADFLSRNADNEKYFKPSERPDHFMFDLPGFISDFLSVSGVEAHWTGHCTYALEDDFFSYRRATHRSENSYGRQLSSICMTDNQGL
ncbi:MAG: peptidoglycan editing factor PgeF [Pseudomonadota bacterium]